MIRRFRPIALAVVAALAIVIPAQAAGAATIYQCFGLGYPSCTGQIQVVTGSKNSSNHTQWVSSITVWRGDTARTKIEAWAGNGPTGVAWYQTVTTTKETVTFTINKWIKNGSGVCGAAYNSDGSRPVACVSIKA